MAIDVNDQIKVNAPRDLDAKRTKLSSGVSVPYASLAEAKSAILEAYRTIGLTVLIDDGDGPVEYWWKDSKDDADLVEKTVSASQVQSDWTQSNSALPSYILHKPTLATVATSGAYSDLSGKPSLATVATTGAYADITGKPLLWALLGNASTTPGTHFIGTTDAHSLMFKVNNIRAGYIDYASGNVSFGTNSMISLTSGYNNIAMGDSALKLNTSGGQNVAIGDLVLYNNLTGINNVIIGHGSAYSNTTGNYNTGMGFGALNLNTTGDLNLAFGYDTMHSNVGGDSNIAIGNSALYSSTSLDDNIAIGTNALYAIATGTNNIGIGNDAAIALVSGSNNLVIGDQALDSTTISNQLLIGLGAIWIKGNSGSITLPSLAGTGTRVVVASATGALSATNPLAVTFITDSDVVTAITGATYNVGNDYTASITPASSKVFNQGQWYKTGNHLYFAIADNASARITLG